MKKIRQVHILLAIVVVCFGVMLVTWKVDELDIGILDGILPEDSGTSVIVKNADDPLWLGESSKAVEVLELLITITRDLNVHDAGILPIHLRINNSGKLYGGSTRVFGRSFMVLSAVRMSAEREATLIHEFAHLLTGEEDRHHDLQWRSTCMVLLHEFNKRKRSEQPSVNGFACTP